MKKTLYNILSVLAVAAVSFMAASCGEKPAPVPTVPMFPELVTDHDVEPGTELKLTIQPNMAWSISIPKESYQWFKIINGKAKLQTLSGVALDEPKEITIWTIDEESFDLRSCDVKMTVGDETKVIASYTLRAKDKTLEVYRASKQEDGTFALSTDGYVYEESPVAATDEIELVWNNNEKKFYFPLKVKANYDWTVQWPSWALADIDAQSKVGDVEFEVYSVASKLPYDSTVEEIRFMNGNQVMKTFKVRIPGCKDMMEYNIGGYVALTFDHAQYFHAGTGTVSNDPIKGFLYGPSGARMVVLELTDAGYVQVQSSWLNAELSAWDGVEGASVLQTREISISVSKHIGNTDRHAMILFLPATAPDSLADILTSDKSGVKQEYARYAVTVTQTACPEEYFTFEASAEDMLAAGLVFERSQSPLLPSLNLNYAEGSQDWQYNLSYVKEMASAKSTFYITYPYETISVYDTDGIEVPADSLAQHWLNYNPLNDGLYGQITMDMTTFKVNKPKEIDGYVVFKNEHGKVLAAVHCFYKEEEKTVEDVLEDVSDKFFMHPDQAKQAGATIYQVISGPTYDLYKEHQAPIYIVNYVKDNTSLYIRTKNTCSMYSCVGKKYGPEMVNIDDQIYHDWDFDALIEKYNAEEEEYKVLYKKYQEDFDAWFDGGQVGERPKAPKKPVYPDVNDDRSTQGLLKFGSTAMVERTYPGYSKFTMKKVADQPELDTEVIQFATSEVILYVFICKLNLPVSSEN